MLSRVADSLYWMSRYLERAEHTARVLGVTLNQTLDQTAGPTQQRWDRLFACLRAETPSASDSYTLVRSVTFDMANGASIAASVTAARENARQIREQISSEMWEQLNRLYLHVRGTTMDEIWRGEPQEFLREVKDGAHLFQGITDSTLSHDMGWQFIQLGRYIERAEAMAALLDVYFGSLMSAERGQSNPLEFLEWVGLLKSCTAFEAYCKVYTASVQPERTFEFLLLNADFPRSLRFSADMIEVATRAIGRASGGRAGSRVDRLAGRLRAGLDYGQVDEIIADMHEYLAQIRRQCAQIHSALYQTYISYPADVALVS